MYGCRLPASLTPTHRLPLQAMFMKTSDSVSLPIFQVLPEQAPTRID